MANRPTYVGLCVAVGGLVGLSIASAACDGDESSDPTGTGNTGGNPTTGGNGGTGGTGTGQGPGGAGGGGSGGGGSGGGVVVDTNANCDPPTGAAGELTLVEVENGFNQPLMLTYAHGDGDRLYVIEKEGRIQLLKDGQKSEFLDIRNRVFDAGGTDERGLLGLAFHPDYVDNGRFFVHYSAQNISGLGDGDTVVEEYRRDPTDPDVADATPVQIIITADQPADNHNGGSIEFGQADGFLYIGLGDGGGGFDTFDNGQNTNTLLAKLLRLDVDSAQPYAVPAGNMAMPPEAYDMGLRNPYRFNFDVCTGDRYIGDVGQECWEEIDVATPADGNRNWGWSVMEGTHCLEPGDCDAAPPGDCTSLGALPIAEHPASEANSITGGHVYRGTLVPWLRGAYVYGDFANQNAWYLRWEGGAVTEGPVEISSQIGGLPISGFGQDNDGELYVVSFNGTVYRVEAAP
jgi:hypothetical protein